MDCVIASSVVSELEIFFLHAPVMKVDGFQCTRLMVPVLIVLQRPVNIGDCTVRMHFELYHDHISQTHSTRSLANKKFTCCLCGSFALYLS